MKTFNIITAIILLIVSIGGTIWCWVYYVKGSVIQYDKTPLERKDEIYRKIKKDEIYIKTIPRSQFCWGFVVSVLFGGIFIWLVAEKFLWWCVCGCKLKCDLTKVTERKWLINGADRIKLKGSDECDYKYTLSFLIGLIERALYTLALFGGFPYWIPFWIGVKVASIRRKGPAHFNMFLFGNMLSLFFGFLGACIALGEFPRFYLVGLYSCGN